MVYVRLFRRNAPGMLELVHRRLILESCLAHVAMTMRQRLYQNFDNGMQTRCQQRVEKLADVRVCVESRRRYRHIYCSADADNFSGHESEPRRRVFAHSYDGNQFLRFPNLQIIEASRQARIVRRSTTRNIAIDSRDNRVHLQLEQWNSKGKTRHGDESKVTFRVRSSSLFGRRQPDCANERCKGSHRASPRSPIRFAEIVCTTEQDEVHKYPNDEQSA